MLILDRIESVVVSATKSLLMHMLILDRIESYPTAFHSTSGWTWLILDRIERQGPRKGEDEREKGWSWIELKVFYHWVR